MDAKAASRVVYFVPFTWATYSAAWVDGPLWVCPSSAAWANTAVGSMDRHMASTSTILTSFRFIGILLGNPARRPPGRPGAQCS